MIALLFILNFLLPAQTSAGAQPSPQPVRVFVHTDDTGDGAELAGRRDSVKDLRDTLAKKKSVIVVSGEDGADMVVEVTDRSDTIPKVVIGVGPATGPAKAVHLRVKVTYGKKEEKEERLFSSKTSAMEASGGWRAAADDIAKQLDKWIAANREALLAGRGGLAIFGPLH